LTQAPAERSVGAALYPPRTRSLASLVIRGSVLRSMVVALQVRFERCELGADGPKFSASRAPVKTGEVLRMEVSNGEGVAIHTGSESCADVCKDGGEALTGVRAGRVLSREREKPHRGADALRVSGRPRPARRYRETRGDPARSETPCMHAGTSFRNREIPRLPVDLRAAGRIGKSKDTSR